MVVLLNRKEPFTAFKRT